MKARLGIVIGVAALAGCGHNVQFGEDLVHPWSYGPPFGKALKDNVPHHPHYPTSRERYALASEHGARHFDSYQGCDVALRSAIASHAGHRRDEISSVESIGTYEDHGEVHEYRCAGAVLTHRSWCRGEAHADAAGGARPAHKKAEAEEGCGAH